MNSTDPLADMLSRIRNAAAVGKHSIDLPHSKLKETIAKILVDNGFLSAVSVNGDSQFKRLEIDINPEGANSTITEIERLSRPGRRLYVSSEDIPTVKRGRGIVVISTSRGMMTGREAKQKKIGGELICSVY
jgi:small subunit ribosomal protein S8